MNNRKFLSCRVFLIDFNRIIDYKNKTRLLAIMSRLLGDYFAIIGRLFSDYERFLALVSTLKQNIDQSLNKMILFTACINDYILQ